MLARRIFYQQQIRIFNFSPFRLPIVSGWRAAVCNILQHIRASIIHPKPRRAGMDNFGQHVDPFLQGAAKGVSSCLVDKQRILQDFLKFFSQAMQRGQVEPVKGRDQLDLLVVVIFKGLAVSFAVGEMIVSGLENQREEPLS